MPSPPCDEKRFVSQIQGRTYANVFGLAERFINAKVLELSQDHWFGDQVALEALVRFSDEELKHQALFRRIDAMIGDVLPEGYRFDVDPNGVAHAVLGKSTWAVLALTLDIELFTQLQYHWREESQHAIIDELEWVRHDAGLTTEQRDRAVDEFIDLVAAVDGILQAQAQGRRRLLRDDVRPCGGRIRGKGDRGRIPEGLPVAIHPLGRPAPPIREGALQPDHRAPGPAIQAALATLH
jgi:hypothetical protein